MRTIFLTSRHIRLMLYSLPVIFFAWHIKCSIPDEVTMHDVDQAHKNLCHHIDVGDLDVAYAMLNPSFTNAVSFHEFCAMWYLPLLNSRTKTYGHCFKDGGKRIAYIATTDYLSGIHVHLGAERSDIDNNWRVSEISMVDMSYGDHSAIRHYLIDYPQYYLTLLFEVIRQWI